MKNVNEGGMPKQNLTFLRVFEEEVSHKDGSNSLRIDEEVKEEPLGGIEPYEKEKNANTD